jgi:UDP-2,3-diacylglucosamine pyrophosphatase LpxH
MTQDFPPGRIRQHQVFIVSDIHLGGRPAAEGDAGFQMCPSASRRRLARFIHYVTRAAAGGGTIELIINGDFVDFLAETPHQPFTGGIAVAIAKLGNVIEVCDRDAANDERVFVALRELVKNGHKLTILLGNHDLELSLPDVRRALLEYLSDGRPAKLEFVYDGEAYQLGDVLIEHGNRYDGWNAVAYGALRALRSTRSRSEEAWPFEPPAGSQLVTSFMNPLKDRYRFIDLLKPENEAVIPVLAALEPMIALELRRLVPLWLAKRKTTGQPGRPRQQESLVASETNLAAARTMERDSGAGEQRIESLDGDCIAAEARARTDAMLGEASAIASQVIAEELGGRVPIEDTAVADGGRPWLTSITSLWRRNSDRPPLRYRLLARALRARQEVIATTFELGVDDPPYVTAARRLRAQGEARVVVFGHTHLAKAIPLPNAGVYLNTGTWCPTIRLDPSLYSQDGDPDRQAIALQALVNDLAVNRVEPWTKTAATFAHVLFAADGTSRAALREFDDAGAVTTLFEERP